MPNRDQMDKDLEQLGEKDRKILKEIEDLQEEIHNARDRRAQLYLFLSQKYGLSGDKLAEARGLHRDVVYKLLKQAREGQSTKQKAPPRSERVRRKKARESAE